MIKVNVCNIYSLQANADYFQLEPGDAIIKSRVVCDLVHLLGQIRYQISKDLLNSKQGEKKDGGEMVDACNLTQDGIT